MNFTLSDEQILFQESVDNFVAKEFNFDRRRDVVAGEDGRRVRIVCIPSFADTHTAILLNLRTLACRPISFNGAPCEEMQGAGAGDTMDTKEGGSAAANGGDGDGDAAMEDAP